MLKIYKFFVLPQQERLLFLRALYFLAYYRFGLFIRPLQTIFCDLERRCSATKGSKSSSLSVRRIARLISVASGLIPSSTCLSKSLAGMVVFHNAGYAVKMHIGVKKDRGEGVAAHAWLTHSDTIVLCRLPDIKRFKEIPLDKMERFQ